MLYLLIHNLTITAQVLHEKFMTIPHNRTCGTCAVKGAIAQVPYMCSNTSIQTGSYCSSCVLYLECSYPYLPISVCKTLGLDSTDDAMFCVT